MLWGDLWKLITEKRQTKATSTNFLNMDSIQKIPANIFVLRKSLEYKYEYCSVLKNHPNTNMNTIQFEKITRIWIQTLVFDLNYLNSIQIPKFKYQIICSPLVKTIQKLFRQSRNCPPNPETVRTIQKQSGQSRNCPDNPESEFLQLAYNTKFQHFFP